MSFRGNRFNDKCIAMVTSISLGVAMAMWLTSRESRFREATEVVGSLLRS